MKADTICVHGDGKHALEFVTQIRNELMKEALIFNPYRGQKMGKIQNKISIKKDKILNSQKHRRLLYGSVFNGYISYWSSISDSNCSVYCTILC